MAVIALPPLATFLPAAVLALAVGLGIILWRTKPFPVKVTAQAIRDWIATEVIKPVAEVFKAARVGWQYLSEVLPLETAALKQALGSLTTWIGAAATALREEIADLLEKHILPLEEWRKDITAYIHNVVTGWIKELQEWRKDVAAYIHNVISAAIAGLQAAVSTLTTRVNTLEHRLEDVWKKAIETFATPAAITAAIGAFTTSLTQVWEPIVKEAEEMAKEIDVMVPDPLLLWWLTQFGDDVVKNIDDVVKRMMDVAA